MDHPPQDRCRSDILPLADRKFIDARAEFLFVDPNADVATLDGHRFDMRGAEYAHEGQSRTFQVMVERDGLGDDQARVEMGRINRDAEAPLHASCRQACAGGRRLNASTGHPRCAGGPGEDQLELLTRINTSEFLSSLGLGGLKWGRPWVQALCRPAARRISNDMAQFDRLFVSMSPRCASSRVLAELVGDFKVRGSERVPPDGPLLIAANHPGLCDVLTVLATVHRNDLMIVAADYPLLRTLTGVNRQFLFVPRSAHLRRLALNRIIAHLRTGGAVLILPAGEIEPDPALSDAAITGLNAWSSSLGLIARRVPNLVLVPAIVCGVAVPRFQRHPLRWIRRQEYDRRQLGMTLQVLARASRQASVRLSYGEPLAGRALADGGVTARAITRAVIARVRMLMLDEQRRY